MEENTAVAEKDVEVEAEAEEEGDHAGEGGGAASACENLPSLAGGDSPSGGQAVVAKLLISNAAAGSVIGKVRVCAVEAVPPHGQYASPQPCWPYLKPWRACSALQAFICHELPADSSSGSHSALFWRMHLTAAAVPLCQYCDRNLAPPHKLSGGTGSASHRPCATWLSTLSTYYPSKVLCTPLFLDGLMLQGGQTIEQIQRNSGARVQLSRAGEFYPGGARRCLIQ